VHWNNNVDGKQEIVIMALASWVKAYVSLRGQGMEMEIATQGALASVMQQPKVQAVVSEMMATQFGRKFE
jgi:hypothetical protein